MFTLKMIMPFCCFIALMNYIDLVNEVFLSHSSLLVCSAASKSFQLKLNEHKKTQAISSLHEM
jgi:hypothetical protein